MAGHACSGRLRKLYRAGEELGYTQSGITQMMKALEKDVGFSLFIKDNHGMSLTADAKALIPAIRSLLNADEVIRQEIASLKGAQVGTIKICLLYTSRCV